MAFTLFGRKDAAPTKKKTAAGAAEESGGRRRKPAPPAQIAAPPDAARPVSDDLSLDFAHYIPSPLEPMRPVAEPPRRKPAAGSPGATRLSREPAPAADATVAQRASESMPAGVPPAPSRAPAAAPVITPAVAAAPPVPNLPQAPLFANNAHSGAADTAPVIKEAAIQFANAQIVQALTALTGAVRHGGLGASALQAWLMLFDLYQHLGMKEEFEALGMEFLVEFERSPPVWLESEPRFDPALATGGVGYCALTGALSDRSAAQFEHLRAIGEAQNALRIDVAKLEEVDQAGCASLLETLEALESAGNEIVITGEEQLLRLLDVRCRMGKAAGDRVYWLLMLEILCRVGLKERFEEAAVNYAVAYEVSPPSWENRSAPSPRPAAGTGETELAPAGLRLAGDVTGADAALPERFLEWAETHSPLEIDMSAVRRVDLECADQLLQVFTRLHQAGVTIQIRGANALVAALFGVVGIDRFARLILKR